MLVYRDDGEPIEPARAWAGIRLQARALEGGASHEAVTAFLIELGEVEAAIADAVFPERDGCNPLADALRHASLAAGRLLVACRCGEPAALLVADLQSALDRVPVVRLPPRATRRVSEGYAYYALHPETYASAAVRFVRDVRPPFVVCLGIRSIGTSLSAVVAAAVEREGVGIRIWSVRPRGHPFDRTLCLAPDLAQALRAAPRGTHYLVVDEGPGLSGSSFAAAATALADVPASNVSLFPSWDADGSSFRSETARTIWLRHRRWVADAHESRTSIEAIYGPGGLDISAGGWRGLFCGSEAEWPAVQPQHERVKRWLPERGEIVRFAGLGRYGDERRSRARALADAGLGPPPGALDRGYLGLPFIEGRPCTAADVDESFLEAIARHTAFVQRTFPACRAPGFDSLCHMIETNLREANVTRQVPRLAGFRRAIEDAPAAAIDGRMLPHEWLRTASGFVKADALDHSSDHFFPGVQDAAWDLAAAEAELGLGDAGRAALLRRYESAGGDRDAVRRLGFYRIAYAAFQLGYATLAIQALDGSADVRRFDRRREIFAGRLRALLAE